MFLTLPGRPPPMHAVVTGMSSQPILLVEDCSEHAPLKKQAESQSRNQTVTRDRRVVDCARYSTPLVEEKGEAIRVPSLVEDLARQILTFGRRGTARAAPGLPEAQSTLRTSQLPDRRLPPSGTPAHAPATACPVSRAFTRNKSSRSSAEVNRSPAGCNRAGHSAAGGRRSSPTAPPTCR